MTTGPAFDIGTILPTKWKPWIAALGGLLAYVIPTLSASAVDLPPLAQAAIALVIAVLTWLGVYRVPFAPKGAEAVIVPTTQATEVHDVQGVRNNPPLPPDAPARRWRSSWRQ